MPPISPTDRRSAGACRYRGGHLGAAWARAARWTAAPVADGITDYYLTNPIARASETMAKCSQEFVHGAAKMAAE